MDSDTLGDRVFEVNNLSIFVFNDNRFIENLQTELRGRMSSFKQFTPSFSSDVIQTTFGVFRLRLVRYFLNVLMIMRTYLE